MKRRFVRNQKKLLNRGKGKQKFVNGQLHSKSEKFFLDILEAVYDVQIERQYFIENRFFDGRYGEHLFEIDGLKWHSRPKDLQRDEIKNRIAKKFGFKLHRIRLDKSTEVPIALERYKSVLDSIFNGDKKSQISSATREK